MIGSVLQLFRDELSENVFHTKGLGHSISKDNSIISTTLSQNLQDTSEFVLHRLSVVRQFLQAKKKFELFIQRYA